MQKSKIRKKFITPNAVFNETNFPYSVVRIVTPTFDATISTITPINSLASSFSLFSTDSSLYITFHIVYLLKILHNNKLECKFPIQYYIPQPIPMRP